MYIVIDHNINRRDLIWTFDNFRDALNFGEERAADCLGFTGDEIKGNKDYGWTDWKVGEGKSRFTFGKYGDVFSSSAYYYDTDIYICVYEVPHNETV